MESDQKDPQQHRSSDSDGGFNQVLNQSIVVSDNLITTTDGFENNEHSWFGTSQIPADLSIQVEDITFYVHKYPMVARCGYLSRIELQSPKPNSVYNLKLENFPGGSETFEIVLKFCYGLPISLSPNNVAELRCASEFLEMTEDLDDGNLISKTEAFFTFVVLSSWRDSIIVLKSSQMLSPWAENLQIVRRCCDSISWKIFQESLATESFSEENWWFEDVTTLRIDHFTRIIVALKAKQIKPETIGSCIMQYAEKWLPSIDVGNEGSTRHAYRQNGAQWSVTIGKKSQEGVVGQSKEHRLIIENLVSVLPPQKEVVSCKFLLWMLKMAIVFSTSQALISELEKRVAMVLEKANVNDLLIPAYTVGDHGKTVNFTTNHTMHDIDVIQRILEYFLMYEHQQQQQTPGMLTVSKLLDNYLAEIARDPDLSLIQFQVLAESLPENARTSHDGLYRAIDTYLKTHTSLSDHDRRRLCKIMNCKKLSLDACIHAAQNDRLPLRTVIQVLFSEQIKMRAIMQGKDQTDNDDSQDHEGSWLCTKKEVNSLKAELESVKAKMAELQTYYFELQQEYGKLSTKQRSFLSWKFGWMKIKRPSIFQEKTDEEETHEGQHGSHLNHKANFRRRMSIS